MTIDGILRGIKVTTLEGDDSVEVSSLSFDSRRTGRGDLFVAVRGNETDGHGYIGDALEAGAVAIICEDLPERRDKGICWIRVEDSAQALGTAASNYYGNPSADLRLVGVTGTNGKTTVATLLYRLYMSLGYPTGLLSTVANYINDKRIEATHTTPDPLQLNRLLAEMVISGCEYAFMEVSSHAVVQQRIAGLIFTGALFTNLTHDHLDYHGTFSNYIAAKKGLFDSLGKKAFALYNADDRNGQVMVQNCRANIRSFSLRGGADFTARVVEHRFEGMLLRIGEAEISTRFTGRFNASNLLAVYGAAEMLGTPRLELLTALSNLVPVEGRFETIISPTGVRGIVDYAHTPDALSNVLSAVNEMREPGNRIITVVGAGGDRDRAKRPEMAAIAGSMSDIVVLTSDNPRSEDPEKIIDEMMKGVEPGMKTRVLRVTSRADAIKTAVLLAAGNDIIVIAGKGHETYQEVKGVRSHFDDREVLREIFLTSMDN
ncbi:MAG: UDP-N-acetylmuramoyl-L-alanyl-D-glutamate--2,6-diaminopimelate ligase [Bacteroidales bacterium]|nr:UDP-N-acetylmuramoyl-L-alanyl-D-glutamate--2,6-diaminopimelate ligase [Bacteroidales bacterium]